MAVTHPESVRNGMANHVVDQLDQGSTNSAGAFLCQTAGEVTIATLRFSATAFGDAVAGVATAAAISDDTNASAGTMTIGKMVDRDDNTIVQCSIGTSGEDVNFSSNVVEAGDTVRLTSLTYTAPN